MAKQKTAKPIKLTTAQVRILHTLARNVGGLNKHKLQQKSGVGLLSAPLGPVDVKDCTEHDTREGYPSLHSLGMVEPEYTTTGPNNTRDTVVWTLTDKGKGAAENYITKKAPKEANRIPREILVPAVKKFSHLRTYAFEEYSDTDMKEIKEELGEEYAHIPMIEIQQQMQNARKVGAFKEEKVETFPGWYGEYCESEHWLETVAKVHMSWDDACAVCSNGTEVRVVHRNFDNLGCERVRDCLPLCKVCRQRARKSLPVVPEKAPE